MKITQLFKTAQRAVIRAALAAAVAALGIGFLAPSASAITIYSDTLTGTGSALNGTTVDSSVTYAGGTAGATWTAFSAYSQTTTGTTGTGADTSKQGAYLPFTPQAGYVYTLTATLQYLLANSNWAALGFQEQADFSSSQFHAAAGNAYAWAYVRGSTGGGPAFFGGGDTGGGQTGAGTAYGLQTVTITFDTTGARWTTYAKIGSSTTSTYTYPVNGNPTSIAFVGFGGVNSTSNTKDFSLSAVSANPPVITATGSPLSALTTTYGTASAPASFTVSGTNMVAGILVTAPTGFEVSQSSGSGYGPTTTVGGGFGTIGNTTVYVRLAATAPVSGTYNAQNIVLASSGAASVNVATASSGNTVTPATLTITANNQNKPFGTTQTTPVTGSTAFTADGLKNSDTVGTVTLTYGSGGLLDTDAVGQTSTITPSAATGGTFTPGNYSITYTPDSGTLTVTTSPAITTSGSLSKVDATYGTATTTPTSFTVSGVDMVAGITVMPPPGFQVSTTSDFSSNVGNNGSPITVGSAGTITATLVYLRLAATATVGSSPYSGNVTCTSLGAPQKNVATASSAVSPATLTITAHNQDKSYGTTQTTPVSGSSAFTADGLKNGDTVGTVTLTYGSGGLAPTDPLGSVSTITPSAVTGGTFTAGNYNIGYSDGTLTVTPGALDHFAISTISSATAGTPITGITLTAQDVNNNTLNAGPSTFSGTVIYSGTAGITGTSSNFTAGVLSGVSVTPTVAGTGLTLIVTDPISGKTGTGIFAVVPGALDHFVISAIPSPQTAGTAISDITFTAMDANTNTLNTGLNTFTGTVAYSGTAGITGTSANFIDGVLSGVSVTPTVAGSGKTLIVTDPISGKTGTRSFDVASLAVSAASSTVVASPANVVANGTSASTITVTLRDVYNNGVSNKTVTLVSSRGTNDTIAAASGPSSAAGVVTFAVRSTTLGESVFSATDVTDSSLAITQTATVDWVVNLAAATGVFVYDTVAGGNGTLATSVGWPALGTYSTTGGAGFSVLTDGNTSTSWLQNWGVANGGNSGFYVTLPAAVTMQGIRFSTADEPGRRPKTMTIEGSFATGTDLLSGANWTLLYSGTAGLDTTPAYSAGNKVSVVNKTAYTSYRVLFPTTVGGSDVQVSDMIVFGVPYKPPQGTIILLF